MPYLGQSLGEFYSFTQMQSVYSAALADWAKLQKGSFCIQRKKHRWSIKTNLSSFLLLTRNVRVSWVRERVEMAEIHRGVISITRELILLRSAFARLIQGHLKALNHLSSSSLPYFRVIGRRATLRHRINTASYFFSCNLSQRYFKIHTTIISCLLESKLFSRQIWKKKKGSQRNWRLFACATEVTVIVFQNNFAEPSSNLKREFSPLNFFLLLIFQNAWIHQVFPN